jgi:hypothetical protein
MRLYHSYEYCIYFQDVLECNCTVLHLCMLWSLVLQFVYKIIMPVINRSKRVNYFIPINKSSDHFTSFC